MAMITAVYYVHEWKYNNCNIYALRALYHTSNAQDQYPMAFWDLIKIICLSNFVEIEISNSCYLNNHEALVVTITSYSLALNTDPCRSLTVQLLCISHLLWNYDQQEYNVYLQSLALTASMLMLIWIMWQVWIMWSVQCTYSNSTPALAFHYYYC